MQPSTVYLGLGSNLGDRQEHINKALELLSEKVQVMQVSSIYETKPVGFSDQPDFLNAVCEIKTSLEPLQLLILAKGIESTMGRTPTFRNGPREIDIDILLYNSQSMTNEDLTLPHPGLEERAFVLVPLAELAPDLVHPASGKTIKELSESIELEGVSKA